MQRTLPLFVIPHSTDMLCDRLVRGVRHKGITNSLLAEKKLNYDKALELAQANESTEWSIKQLQSTQT